MKVKTLVLLILFLAVVTGAAAYLDIVLFKWKLWFVGLL